MSLQTLIPIKINKILKCGDSLCFCFGYLLHGCPVAVLILYQSPSVAMSRARRALPRKCRCFLIWPRSLEKWGILRSEQLGQFLAHPSLAPVVSKAVWQEDRHMPADSSDCHPQRQRSGVLCSPLKDDQYTCFPRLWEKYLPFLGKTRDSDSPSW